MLLSVSFILVAYKVHGPRKCGSIERKKNLRYLKNVTLGVAKILSPKCAVLSSPVAFNLLSADWSQLSGHQLSR